MNYHKSSGYPEIRSALTVVLWNFQRKIRTSSWRSSTYREHETAYSSDVFGYRMKWEHLSERSTGTSRSHHSIATDKFRISWYWKGGDVSGAMADYQLKTVIDVYGDIAEYERFMVWAKLKDPNLTTRII